MIAFLLSAGFGLWKDELGLWWTYLISSFVNRDLSFLLL